MATLMRFADGPDTQPTPREWGLISRYISGELPLKREKALERRLLDDAAFHRRVANSLRMDSIISRIVLPAWKKSGAHAELQELGPGPTDRYEASLVEAIASPGVRAIDELVAQWRRDVAENGRLGRPMVAAVRRLKFDRHVTLPEADALVFHIASALRSDTQELAGLLVGFDEEHLSKLVRKDHERTLEWTSEQLVLLKARIGRCGRDWTVDYPMWGEDDPDVTVCVDAGPDEKMVAIQRERATGAIDAPEAWWLINMRAVVMVGAQFWADVVYGEIVERLEDLEAAGRGPVDPDSPDADETASSEWRTLHAARYRRMGVYTRHVLRAAGEEEMVRVMVERPAEYQRRSEWVG